jgi:ribose-phosphate pyrophosphokinase
MILLNSKEVEFGSFPNGETLFKKDGLEIATSIPNEISFKYENDSDLIKLMFLKNYLDIFNVRNNLTIYYMPYSRMDRSEDGSPFTLKYVANFINNLKFDYVEIVEPHSDVTCALVDRSLPRYINYQLIGRVIEEVGFNPQNDYIVFPDAGAQKRYTMRFPNVLVGNKKRDFTTGNILGLDIVGDINNVGTKAIIVDDLTSKGTTFVKTAEKLIDLGMEEIYLLVAHAENTMFKGELFDGLIDKIFTTDSHVTEHGFWSSRRFQDKLKIYDIEEVLKSE